MRAAIYARYSDDKQNARSIEDQIEVCTRHAALKGWAVIGAFTDAAISGEHMVNRPGLKAAVAAGEDGKFDILLAEDEDRIARNLEHLAHVKNRLTYAGAVLATLTTDVVTDMHVAFKGLIGSDFLRNLSQKTKRGMHANAERGAATGSRIYGYETDPGGAMRIVEPEAQIVRRIFLGYAVEGLTPREIVARLNAEHIPGPRGGPWNPSTLNGSAQRGNGLLRTELYAGVKVWNRIAMSKDPVTGARISRPRPPAEWRRTPVPQLAILSSEIWAAARARNAAEAHARPHQLVRRRQAGLLSGLLKCAYCGSSYTVASGDKLTCAGRRERGPAWCANGRTVQRQEIEARVLEGLRTRLMSPAAVAEYIRAFREAFAAEKAAGEALRRPLERRLAEVGRGIDRAVDAIVDGVAGPSVKTRLVSLEAEQAQLQAELEALGQEEQTIVELHPNAPAVFARQIAQLQQSLDATIAGEAGRTTRMVDDVRGLIDRIEISPHGFERGDPIDVILYGRLAAFVDVEAPGVLSATAFSSMRKVVAGGRYRQTHTAIQVAVMTLGRK